MITSLNAWRKGWQAAGRTYDIYAYAKTNVLNSNENMATIYFLNGLYIGLQLPISAQQQDTWDVTTGPNAQPDSWGGHCVYVKGYDTKTLTCVTWGKPQQMTWNFFMTYCDQAFGVIDNKDNWVTNSAVDVTALSQILAEITGEPIPTPNPTPGPTPTGILVLQITPANAVMTINGKVVSGQPTSLNLPTGQYTVQASLKGYKTQQQNTYVLENQTTLVTINLIKSKLCIFN